MYPFMEKPPKQTFDGDRMPQMPVTNIMASVHLTVLCVYLCHRSSGMGPKRCPARARRANAPPHKPYHLGDLKSREKSEVPS